MRKGWLLVLLLVSISVVAGDSIQVEKAQQEQNWLQRTISGFTRIDENYVEPQHYDWSVMLQATHTYDYYRLSTSGDNKQSVRFSPTPNFKVGPYFGWRWAFLGYTFDLKNIDVDIKSLKQEIDFSFYSAQIGADFYYRRTGSDYHISDVKISNVDTSVLEGEAFDGISVGITGLNVYYIFNHQRFSYPAAFNQSTRQKISCGSWMTGLGYTRNSIDFDYDRLQNIFDERLSERTVKLDEGLKFNSVNYYNISVSAGYAYNWVFAPYWLLASSLSLALAYKKTRGISEDGDKHGFDFNNLNIDGIGRFGIVYNNDRFYAGASAIVRAYNYRKSRFQANNVFGSLNIYVGYNFGLKKAYKQKKKP